MSQLKFAIPFGLIVMLSACATAPSTPQKDAASTASPKAESTNAMKIVINTKRPLANASGEKYICKEFQKTGSRLRTVSKCHTQAEWDVLESETKRTIRDMYIKPGSDHG